MIMKPALFLIALEKPGQSYQGEVPSTFIYIRCVGGEPLSMKVQILFQERGGDTRIYGEPKEALLIHVEDSRGQDRKLPPEHSVLGDNY